MITKILSLLSLTTTLLLAQAPDVQIFDQSTASLKAETKRIGQIAAKLLEENKTLNIGQTKKLSQKPTGQKITLPSPSTTQLTPTQIAAHATKGTYRIGWSYLCPHCDNWHTSLAGGYAVSADGMIITCAHVIEASKTKMRKGALIAIDQQGNVHPVKTIHAYNRNMDAALIQIDAQTTPFTLSDQTAPGDPAYCLSRPLKQGKYFTQGIVNRFYWSKSPSKKNPTTLKDLENLKLNVSSRWAPGSSGSPVFDHFGNVIGHVALIKTMGQNDKKQSFITLHTAVPARSITALITE